MTVPDRVRSLAFLLIGGAFLVTLPLIGCGTSKEKQEVLAYIDDITPLMNDDAAWHDEQNALMQTRNSDANEFKTRLKDLLRRMERIYLGVIKSLPPEDLRKFKSKWSLICQLELQTLTLTLLAFEEKNLTLFPKINDLTFQANNAKTEADDELRRVFTKYDID